MSLTRRDFRAWLEGLPPNRRVGYRSSPCDCPLAWFLRSDGARLPSVSSTTYSRGSGRYRELPEWAVLVVAAIDRATFRNGVIVTAGEALELAGKYL